MNRRIALLFACGSTLFMLGGILSLAPALAARWSLSVAGVNMIYFAGSIPFSAAAYLQLFQSANTGRPDLRERGGLVHPARFGWRPGDIGWLGCALQFAGTLLFNMNTLDAMQPGVDWLQQDLAVWAPDMIGSALFLASGYLAFIECWRSVGAWQPGRIAWWISVVNLLGCVAFMGSALLAFAPVTPAGGTVVAISTGLTTAGAAAFLLGSLLMLPEVGVAA